MLSGKQRSYLKSLAVELSPAAYVGKGGLTDNTLKDIDDYLTAHEIIKVSIQENAYLDAKETANLAAEKLGAEYVQAIGRKFVLFRMNPDNRQIFIP